MRGALPLLVAQGASSAGNLLLTVLIARNATALEFAAFALLFPAYMVLQRFLRVYALIPLQISQNKVVISNLRRPSAEGEYSTVLCSSFLAGVLLLTLLPVLPPSFTPWAVLIGAMLPGLCLYDFVRNQWIARGERIFVGVADSLWLGLQAIGSTVIWTLALEPHWFLIAWGVPPIAIALAFRPRGMLISFRMCIIYMRRSKEQVGDAASDLVSSLMLVQLVPALLAVTLSLEAAGGYRAAHTLLGPINVVLMGLMPHLQIESARRSAEPASLAKTTRAYSWGLVALTSLAGIPLLFIPESVGRSILGETWALAAVMLPGVVLHLALRIPLMVAFTVLRSTGGLRRLLRWRTCSTVTQLLGIVPGLALDIEWLVPIGMAIGAFTSWMLGAYGAKRSRRGDEQGANSPRAS